MPEQTGDGPDRGAQRRAAEVYRAHQASTGKDTPTDLDRLCREHPDLELELRRLHAAQLSIDSVQVPHVTSDFDSKVETWGMLFEDGADGEPRGEVDLAELVRGHGATERYFLQGEIARGGMGVVLKVWDSNLRRNLAMKVILGDPPAADKTAAQRATRLLARFLREAQVTSQLDHPGVVPVHELGIDDTGQVYFTMRLVKGLVFDQIIDMARERREGWSMARALGALQRVCETMAFAHAKHVVHRDLKPENIMVGRFGETYVMDWGVARVVDPDAEQSQVSIVDVALDRSTDKGSGDGVGVTQEGLVIGTPSYMAPEQARGRIETLGPQADVYSVGSMLYHLLTGVRPFTDEVKAPVVIVERLLAGPPTPARKLAPRLPAELFSICERAMQREVADRYPSMVEMADDLRAFLEGRVVRAHRVGAWAELSKYVVRNKAVAALSLLALLSIVGFALQQLGKARAIEAEQRKTQQARDTAVENLELAQRQGYVANLIAASASIRDRESDAALRHLESCEASLRGWEWRHLRLRADSSSAILTGSPAGIGAVAVDRRGVLVASAGDDGVVRVWDVEQAVLRHALEGHRQAVAQVAFGGPGDRLYSLGGWDDPVLKVWDAGRGALVGTMTTGDHTPLCFAVHPTRAEVAFATSAAAVVRMNADPSGNGARVVYSGHVETETVVGVAFALDGEQLLALAEDGRLLWWEVDAAAPRGEIVVEGHATALAVRADAGVAALGFADGSIELRALPGGELQHVLSGHHDAVTALSFAEGDGALLVSASFDRSLCVWDAQTGMLRAAHSGHQAPVRGVVIAPRGGFVASASADRTVRLWPNRPVGGFALERRGAAPFTAVGFGDHGGAVLSGSAYPGVLRRHGLGESGAELTHATEADEISSVAVSRDGTVAVVGLDDWTVLRLVLSTGDLQRCSGHGESVTDVAIDSSGQRLVSASDDKTARVWDASGALLHELRGHQDQVTSVAMSLDGRYVITGALDADVRLWDADTGTEVRRWTTDGEGVLAVALSPDAGTVAAATTAGAVHLWAAAGDASIGVLRGPDRPMQGLAFSPDGARVVTGSDDALLRVWDPVRGTFLVALRGHTAAVVDVAFSGDGNALASVDSAGELWIWQAR